MEPATYVEHLRRDCAALGAAARADLAAPVAACPGWDMAQLVSHTGGIHRWAAETIRTAATDRISMRTLGAAPDDVTARPDWFDEGASALVALLEETDPDAAVWTFGPGGVGPSRFWHRRMAQETAVHRWDAQAAATGAGSAAPVDAALAVDGIDELFEVFAPRRLAATPVAGRSASLHLHATDIDGEWFVALHPDHLDVRHEHAKADAAVRGPASELLLWLWNRRPADAPDLQVFGDAAVIEQAGAFAS